ncbi:alanine:cation symporter family protein [Corynebacterium diphtheriae bv. mitis]|uniref:alanine/glycine:cation symporter family protein n=1 Tax=Corynebacterium diphtheriae TaxID=1717 RepID=UPI0018C92315|nr:alanine/glycine:cation symporter family protein [Corynebacterium diphtheriae]MBG9359347.1 alanine:cation symporter family protein [Corynebacterium diphtheriae bv. mitis]MBG9361488.1 alanine:cation symporter family protein [Corynebacterium diphtheriae bv. mitis]MBG9363653.1 alanine:cation symporter family protein [Corynebacterium diphtheriae bv. mitis]MBG9365935.1 alanine:cation symporter family protein [Corynebacterium diphtheriae bv. mitis]
MNTLIETLNSIIWSPFLVFLCLGAGLYFTIATKCVQVTGLPDMLRQLRAGEKSANGVSSFQSLMMSLAGRVGVGNIAGVATAIAFGGPGAVFWMWAVAFLGAATSFIECTLAQIYKERDQDTGEYRGGPAYYIEKSLKHTKAAPFMLFYAIAFAVVMIFSTSYFMPGVQANGVASAMHNAWNLDVRIVGASLTVLLALIIFGGVKRIAWFASLVVPFMAVVYIIIALVVLFMHFDQIPHVFGTIFSSAFNANATFSGLLGSAIMWGVRRGIYSNEAGQGLNPQAAAAAAVSHPAKQGFAQAFAVYVDTLFVCSATAFIIISTDMYRVFEGGTEDSPVRYAGSLPSNTPVGPGFVQQGLDSVASGVGPSFIGVAILFFGFTTILSYYYISETNFTYLMRWISNATARRATIFGLRCLMLVSVWIGAVSTPGAAWALGDIGAGATAWLNVIAILILQVPAIKCLRDYNEQKKSGLDPQFDPAAVGIKNAEFWETYKAR